MKKYIVLFFILSLVSGCGALAENYLPDNIIVQGESKNSPYITDNNEVDLSKVDIKALNGAAKQAERNEVISQTLSLSQRKCVIHKAGILSNVNTWNVGTGSAAILFTGAAAVVSHAKMASDLAAAAAATLGVKSLVNEEVYADAMATTILRAIEVRRAKTRASIEQGMKNPNYTFYQAIVDLQQYHSSCSLMAGLIEVTKALENRKQSRHEIERDIQELERTIARSSKTLSGVSRKVKQKILDDYAKKLAEKTLDLYDGK